MPPSNCKELDNRAGVVNRILYGYADDVQTWPEIHKSDNLDFASSASWYGRLMMKEGKRMYELYFTDESGVITITDQGDKGGESFLFDLTLVRSKINAVMAGFENAITGQKLVIIAQDRNGNKYLMGDELVPCVKVAGDGSTTGTTATDRNQSTLKFQYTCPRKLLYQGDLDYLLKEVPSGPRITKVHGFAYGEYTWISVCPVENIVDRDMEWGSVLKVNEDLTGKDLYGYIILKENGREVAVERINMVDKETVNIMIDPVKLSDEEWNMDIASIVIEKMGEFGQDLKIEFQ